MKSTQRIGLLLALVFLLPALFFSVYELSSLDKDEKMIQDIYGKQLEAILFSVNQYSDDIVGNWISRIETSFDPVWSIADLSSVTVLLYNGTTNKSGTGTLIIHNKRYFILTALHVSRLLTLDSKIAIKMFKGFGEFQLKELTLGKSEWIEHKKPTSH